LWPYRREYFANNRFDITDPVHKRLCVGRYISWDTAFKTKADSDYSAWVVADVQPDYTLQIIECGMERYEFPDLLVAAEELAARHDHDDKLMGVIIEDKATGGPLYESLARWSPWLANFLFPYMPQADKDERSRQAAPWAKRGMISLPYVNPHAAPWLPMLEDQLFNQFPHKEDIRDAFNQLLIHRSQMLTDGWAARTHSRVA
jgi:phage terminase large subunit-like protein